MFGTIRSVSAVSEFQGGTSSWCICCSLTSPTSTAYYNSLESHSKFGKSFFSFHRFHQTERRPFPCRSQICHLPAAWRCFFTFSHHCTQASILANEQITQSNLYFKKSPNLKVKSVKFKNDDEKCVSSNISYTLVCFETMMNVIH